MPKIRRRKPFKRQDYDIKNLELAVMAVQAGLMSGTHAAFHYGVPRTTIHTRLAKLEQLKFDFLANTPDILNVKQEETTNPKNTAFEKTVFIDRSSWK